MKSCAMLRNRMLADPSFLFKVGVEVCYVLFTLVICLLSIVEMIWYCFASLVFATMLSYSMIYVFNQARKFCLCWSLYVNLFHTYIEYS